jgi:hypothetical protein
MAAAKSKKREQAGVLAALPSTRPSRMSRRGRELSETATPAKAKPAKKAAAKAVPKAAPAPRTATKPTPKPPAKPAATTKAKPAPPKPARPRAVRPTTPALKEPIARAKARSDEEPLERSEAPIAQAPSGTELVSTVVQAAGELASIGMTVGGQILKRAVQRLPKP